LGLLKRNTIWPKQGFVIVKLESETIDSIFQEVTAAGLSQAIIHIQIERSGILELGAYNNFHPECVGTGPEVPVSLLSELKSKNILRDFVVAKHANG
jgi:hypothetical protein